MAPLQSKKRKSADPHAPNVASAGGPSNIPGTPTGSPARKKMKITLAQKQSLIDNLQLEITDRARRLRATYAHQALSLRSRIETRVNRIPRALRKATMGELLAKYTETLQLEAKEAGATLVANLIAKAANSHPLPAIPHEISSKPPSAPPSPAKTRGLKRTSDALQPTEPFSDKENALTHYPDPETQVPLSNPKKRSKPNPPTTTVGADRSRSRAASRATKAAPAVNKALQPPASKVLSPRSPNSRTIQYSPSRNSPTKSLIARPVSPLKPASPLKATTLMVGGAVAASLAGMVEHAKHAKEKARKISPRGLAEARKEKKAAAAAALATTTTTATATRGTRKAVAVGKGDEHERTVSASSNSSSGTTVVTKGVAAKKPVARKAVAEPKTTAAAKKGAASAAAKAAVAKKPAPVEVPAAGRRVLRKRA